MSERTVAVDYLARVEGEGALTVRLRGREVEAVQLRIFEPPRFFEAFLRGRAYREAPDITARICGICPVAYQMSACHALERALGLQVDGGLRELRRLLYCGEWIESHSLHIFLLHAPDFLGVPDAVALARAHPERVREGLELKQAGNAILETIGGREIHPINVRVGGFYGLPEREVFEALRPGVERARELAESTVRWVATFPFPEAEESYEYVALRHPSEYPMNEGEVVSSEGMRWAPERFDEAFEEVQVPYSNAYHVVRRGAGPYLVGPLARWAQNHDRATPQATALAREIGLEPTVRNPHRAIIVRALEVLLATEEALRILDRYRRPERPYVPDPTLPDSAEGAAITEAPRGMLFHRYRLGPGGRIESARIVAPTTQNQKRIEVDLEHLVRRSLDLDDTALATACERAVRNHDPCISCATHFLRLEVVRG